MPSIHKLAEIAMEVAGKKLTMKHTAGPQGVHGRTSDNRLIKEKLGWNYTVSLKEGIATTYQWINEQAQKS